MKILFYGGYGWLATYIIDEFKRLNHEIIISNNRIEPNNKDIIENEIIDINPDRVFCCLGRTSGFNKETNTYINNIDYLETNLKENMNDNLYSPLLLGFICNKLNIHLSYMGTGCIFSENTNDIEKINKYKEEDNPNFFGSSYSIVKGYTDILMKQYMNVLNIRIRMPIIKEKNNKNFITKIFAYKKICSYPNSMTYLPDMIPIIVDLCINQKNGTYNCVNKGYISHKNIFDIYNNNIVKNNEYQKHIYELINENELNNILKSKRSNNVLDTTKLEKEYNIRDINECINECINYMIETSNL